MTLSLPQLAWWLASLGLLLLSVVCMGLAHRNLWKVIRLDREIIASQAKQIALLEASRPHLSRQSYATPETVAIETYKMRGGDWSS